MLPTQILRDRRFRLATCAAAVVFVFVAACHKDSPQDHLARGKEAAAKGNHATAVIEFKNVLQADANALEARYLLGRELLAQGDAKNAEIELRKAYDGQYDPDLVLPLLVGSEVQQGETDRAARDVERATLKSPDAKAALQSLLGSSLLAQGNTDAALAAYTAAERFVPDFPAARLGEARIKAMKGDVAGAKQQVEAVLAKNPKLVDGLILRGDIARTQGAIQPAIDSYLAALKESPSSFLARLDLASAYIANQQPDLAQKQIDDLKKAAPKHPGVNYLDALIAFNKKDYARANDAISVSLAAAPNSALGQLLAGAIATATNQPAQAEAHLRDTLKANPNSVYARKLLTSLYLRQRQPDKAEEVLAPALTAAPDDATVVSLAGEIALLKGDFKNASKFFDKVGRINPADANVRTQGAAIDFARGDEAAGFAALEAASKSAVDNPNPDIALVLAHVQRKQFDQALAAWKTLEKRQPDNPTTYNLRASIDLGRGDLPAARKALEHALQLQPTYFPAVANLAALDERAGNYDGARQRFKALLAKDPGNLAGQLALAQFEAGRGAGPDVVVPLLKEARRTNPNAEQPVLALAGFYASRNDPKNALAIVQDALAQAPDNASYLNLDGSLLLQTGSVDQAVAAFRKLVNLYPDTLDYAMRLGAAQAAANQPDVAVQTFTTALRKKPDAFPAQAAAVGSLLRANQVAAAAKLLDTIRTLAPGSPSLPELEGDVKLSSKQYADAAAIFRRQLATSPSSNLVLKTYSSLYLGGNQASASAFLSDWIKAHPKDVAVRLFDADLALRAKDYPRAVQNYRTALEVQPDDAAVLNNLAWALWQQKDPQALAYARKALSAAPDNPAVADTLGWMLVEQGDTKRGLELLQKASSAAPAQRDIALHLAKAQLKDGRKDAARSTLQALVNAAPDSKEGEESKALMATL